MKKIFLIGLVLLVAVLAGGCASYTVQNIPSRMDDNKVVKTGDNEILITALPILTEEDGRKYFDANLIGKNIVAVHLNILNFSSDVAEFAESNLTINNSILTQLSVEDVYRVIRREYTAKAIAWLSITYGVGGPILAAHTAGINKKIMEDLQSKCLKLGDIVKSKASIRGFLLFKIPDEAMRDDKLLSSNLGISIKKGGKLVKYSLPIPSSKN